jgi:hypothetical protein
MNVDSGSPVRDARRLHAVNTSASGRAIGSETACLAAMCIPSAACHQRLRRPSARASPSRMVCCDTTLRQESVHAAIRAEAPIGIAVLHGVLEAGCQDSVRLSKNSLCDKVPQELEALPRLRHR